MFSTYTIVWEIHPVVSRRFHGAPSSWRFRNFLPLTETLVESSIFARPSRGNMQSQRVTRKLEKRPSDLRLWRILEKPEDWQARNSFSARNLLDRHTRITRSSRRGKTRATILQVRRKFQVQVCRDANRRTNLNERNSREVPPIRLSKSMILALFGSRNSTSFKRLEFGSFVVYGFYGKYMRVCLVRVWGSFSFFTPFG